MVGFDCLFNGLYKIELDLTFANSISIMIRNKKCRMDEMSSMLWHRSMSHISGEMMERLIKEWILDDLEFSNFDSCVDYINAKNSH